MAKEISGKFAIERAAPGNTGSFWPPTQTPIRGRWDHMETHCGNACPEYLKLVREFRYIQGQCVEIDVDNRTMRVYDPYGEPSNKETLAKLIRLNNAIAEARGGNFAFTNGVEPELVVRDATPDQLKEWLFCARRWLDKGKAVEVRGRGLSAWPTMDAIVALPGKIRESFFNEIETKVNYIHEVPVEV